MPTAPKPSPSPAPIPPERRAKTSPSSSEDRSGKQLPAPKIPFRKRVLRSCLFTALIVCILSIFGITYAATASGLVNIPGLSSVLYKTPQPTREVSEEEMNSGGIKDRVQREVSTGKDQVRVFITEGNLTYILNTNKQEDQKLENAQVAIIDDGSKMEIFGKMINSNVYLSATYNIGKDFEGNFKIENISEFRVGNVKVPYIMIYYGIIPEESIKNLLAASTIESALSDEGTELKILDIEFSEGEIIELVALLSDNDSNLIKDEESLETGDQSTQVN